MTQYPVHGRIDGPLVMIGFGSIGRGTLPLIERHFDYDRDSFTVIEPSGEFAGLLAERGIRHLQFAFLPQRGNAVADERDGCSSCCGCGQYPGYCRIFLSCAHYALQFGQFPGLCIWRNA